MMEQIHSVERSLENLLPEDDSEMLRSRIDEQSNLISLLKQRADEMFLRCQSLQKVNMELEGRVIDCKKELDHEKTRLELVEKRFMELASRNQEIISFMDEYKKENAQLKTENKDLQSQNENLFSKKLQDKEVSIQKLLEENKLLTGKYTYMEKEYREKLDGCESKLREQSTEFQAKEASLLHQFCDSQKRERDAETQGKDLTLKLRMAEKENSAKEITLRESITSLTKERDKLLHLSVEREQIIQVKKEEIQSLEMKLKEEEIARIEAEERFEQEADAVNADLKVQTLKSALEKAVTEHAEFQKKFEAFRVHHNKLLKQEKELNRTLSNMLGQV